MQHSDGSWTWTLSDDDDTTDTVYGSLDADGNLTPIVGRRLMGWLEAHYNEVLICAAVAFFIVVIVSMIR
jgi:hypothetical protein